MATVNNGYFIGLMSGTSLDGIDAVVAHINDDNISLHSSCHVEWPVALKASLQKLIEKQDSLDEMLRLDQLCAEQYAAATLTVLKESGLAKQDIVAIGSHGQTIRHAPEHNPGYTLQIGNPARIAELTNLTTVTDFRSRDIAAGGQGAPLAPAFHQAIFEDKSKTRVVLNIGGIANITLLNGEEVIGYDTGPGNRLLDDWCHKHTGKDYDENGHLAASGQVNQELLKQLLADPYFKADHPKSTGSDYFNLAWLEPQLQDFSSETAANIQATLSALSANSITEQIKKITSDCDEVLVCGGGAHNTQLMQQLQALLPESIVVSTEAAGIHPDWVEAMAFAWLAHRSLSGLPGNLPSVTGAKGPRILGGIYSA